MASNSTRSITITSSGDYQFNQAFSADANSNSPSQSDLVSWASGFNLITPPAGGSTPKAVTIIPPAGNTVTITLKGITGDTGVLLHPTDPTTIALGSPSATFGITTSAILAGVRLIWT
jgi:hypothetical protein